MCKVARDRKEVELSKLCGFGFNETNFKKEQWSASSNVSLCSKCFTVVVTGYS